LRNIAVFISGEGTTLGRIIEACDKKEIDVNLALVVSSNEKALGVALAKGEGIDVVCAEDEKTIIEALVNHNIDLIILAGYLKLISEDIINNYSKKIINIHPSLLPKFKGKGMYGINVHKAVIEAKEAESGATIHYVDKEYDNGKIIAQEKVDLEMLETPESLNKKIKTLEKKMLIEFLKKP